jgi:hypothetical protein
LIGWQKVSQLAVTVVAVYIPPLVAARHHVVSGTGMLDAYLACHRRQSCTQSTALSTLNDVFRD